MVRLDSIPVGRPSRRNAAEKAVVAVNRLDSFLDGLRPTDTEAAAGSPVGRAWASLIGAVARAQLRADELLESVTPARPKNDQVFQKRLVRRRQRVSPV